MIYDSELEPENSVGRQLAPRSIMGKQELGLCGITPVRFLGSTNNPAIKFDPPIGYDNDGNNPSAAIDPVGCPTAIEVHNTGLGPEWYHVGTYTCPIINLKPGTK